MWSRARRTRDRQTDLPSPYAALPTAHSKRESWSLGPLFAAVSWDEHSRAPRGKPAAPSPGKEHPDNESKANAWEEGNQRALRYMLEADADKQDGSWWRWLPTKRGYDRLRVKASSGIYGASVRSSVRG